LDFSDERYVRVYTRDTATWECLEWDGQCVFVLLMRKVDRAGVLDFGDGNTVEEAVKAVTRLPLHVVETGLPKLLKHKVLAIIDQQLVIIKFIEAQEAVHSEKFRSREYRAKRRDLRRRGLPDTEPAVTKRDAKDRSRDDDEDANEADGVNGRPQHSVTKRDGIITKQDSPVTGPVKTVTPSLAMPSRTGSVAGSSQNKNQKRDEDPGASSDPLPSPPRRRGDILNAPVSADDYEPLADHELYAKARGLSPSEYDATVMELRQKGWGPAAPSRWDARLSSFIDAAVMSKTRVRATQPKLSVVASTAPYVPSTSNGFDGPIARMLFADDDDEDEGKEA